MSTNKSALKYKKDNPGCLEAAGFILVALGLLFVISAVIISVVAFGVMFGWNLVAENMSGVAPIEYPAAWGITAVVYLLTWFFRR